MRLCPLDPLVFFSLFLCAFLMTIIGKEDGFGWSAKVCAVVFVRAMLQRVLHIRNTSDMVTEASCRDMVPLRILHHIFMFS